MNAKGNANDPGFDQFVDQILGLRLSLMEVPIPVSANGEDPLIVALKTPGQLSANIQQLARGRIDAISDAQLTTPEDRALFLALWADPRIDLKARYDGAARILLRDTPPDFADAVAKIGFARMDSLLLPDPHRANLSHIEQIDLIDRVGPIKQQIGLIGFVLAQLPDAALQPYGPALFALAKDRENRTEPYQLLIRLSGFGDLGARALVDLLADAKFVDNGDPFYYNFRQNAYSAAMTGLCRMGPRAASVLPDLLKLVKKGGVIMSYGEGGQLTATVLIRLGQPVDTILGLSGHEKYPMTEQDIDLAQQRANQPDVCQY